jgi:putative inorganic carbon (HCO3(-)) transporter
MDFLRPARRDAMFFALALTLVAIYFVLRTLSVPSYAVTAWATLACIVALVSPLAGVTVLAAIAPFTEALTAAGEITPIAPLLAVLGLALLVHAWLRRPVPRMAAPVIAAIALFCVTLLGVVYSAAAFGPVRAVEAIQSWVPGIGGGLTVLIVAAWLARQGELRPLAVGVGAISAAAAVSLLDFYGRGVVQHSALGWLVREGIDRGRLLGVLDAPNPAATLFVGGAAVTLSVALFDRRPPVRLLAALASAFLVAATLATLSRSGVLALALVGTILAWRRWRPAGIALAIVALAIGVVIATGGVVLRVVPSVFDTARVDAWRASVSMWLAAPLTGEGFRSFEWLHDTFGSALDAPHNEWLRLFAEEGTAGGLIGLAFVVTMGVTLLRTSDWRVTAAGAAFAALVLMACFNNPMLYVQVTASVLLVVGSGLGLAIGRAERPPPGRCEG